MLIFGWFEIIFEGLGLTKIFRKFSVSILRCLLGQTTDFSKIEVEARFSRVTGAEEF